MQLRVRNVLALLPKANLVRICEKCELAKYGNREQLIRRLVDWYWGDVSALIDDLTRNELEAIADDLSSRIEFPRLSSRTSVVELKKILKSVITTTTKEYSEAIETSQVELFCTGDFTVHGGDQIRRFDAAVLSKAAASSDRVTVVSAYYSDKGLRAILQNCRGKKRVVLNGLGGHRLKKQAEELRSLNRKLKAEFRLGFAPGIFHTKLYLFEYASHSVAWIGSANSTDAGLSGHNEEILVRIEPVPASVLAYTESVWNRGQEINQFHSRVTSIETFLRTGTLYYKPYTLLRKTINPFQKLMDDLPREETAKLPQTFESAFSDEEAGIGAFNLELVYESHPDTEGGSIPKSKPVHFRVNAVETCYGYWVPEYLVKDVDALLKNASKEKIQGLREWQDWLLDYGSDIVAAYCTYLTDAKRFLDEYDVNWSKYTSADLFQNTEKIERFLDVLTVELGDEDRLTQHSQAWVPTEVPEIWDDIQARRAFEDSFFDSLATASTKKTQGAARLILNAIKLDLDNSTAKEIKNALIDSLKDESWYERNLLVQEVAD